jgi:anti-sigma factor RsiW
MTMRQSHLSDDRLIDVCLRGMARRGDAGVTPAERQHLAGCPTCEDRHARLVRLLTEVREVATAQADATFTPDRLAKQRVRLAERIEHEARHGRVITFPAVHAHTPSLRARPGMRWVAGAAAAGVIIGLVAGQLVYRMPRRALPPPSLAVTVDPAAETLQLVAVPLSEEEFLGRIEMAVEGTAGAALRPLDDLTPRVWEVAAQ